MAQDIVEVRSPRISVSYDSQFQRRLEWKGASGNIIAFDPSAQEGITVFGAAITTFRLDPSKTIQRTVEHPEFGAALEAKIQGVFTDTDRKLTIERVTRILLPQAFPDAAIFETSYRNLSARPIHLDRVDTQRVVLDRKLTEPQAKSYDFASYQGGAYKWGLEYALIRLQPDFSQSNFQGLDDVLGPEGVGGGMPFIDVWGPTMGVALAHLAKEPQWLSLPVEVRPDRKVEMSIAESPLRKFAQQEWLAPGETYSAVINAVIFHRLDYFDALRTYSRLLRRRGIAIPDSSPELAHEPYWKSWGWMEHFTIEKFLNILPELKSMGIRTANLDMGWYDQMGDWQPNREPGKFPNGEPDVVAFVHKLHDAGFRSSFWWYPLAVSPKSRLAREHADLLVQDENGNHPMDANQFHQLCPAYPPALAHIRAILARAVSVWGFDGVYTDYMGMSAVPACFNPAHHHQSPLDSFKSMPKVYELIQKTIRELKPSALHEVCICSLPHSPYYMPYYDIANASDPVSTAQVRSRVKAEKAIRGTGFTVGDCYQVPIQEWTGYSVPESFETAIGTGAQLTTFYTQLDERQRALWTRWFHEYKELDLSRAEYVNLYDLAWDKPEVHVIRKGQDLYYGIFADTWPRDKYKIELRGLEKGKIYRVYDYVNRRDLGTLDGSKPLLNIGFKESLLVRVSPQGQ